MKTSPLNANKTLAHLVAVSCCYATFIVSQALAAPQEKSVQFNRDIRPVLSDTCFSCHGFDANTRKADLRLDTPEGAIARRKGKQAIKGGDLKASELWQRITSTDPKVMMPPPDAKKKLTTQQIALIGKWIEQGGAYEKHWAFEPPVRPSTPEVKKKDWPKTDLDRFILAKLESKQLTPASEAPKETLIRRVTLDLTGLPPTPAEVDSFLADQQPNAYDKLVERLLGSPRYGEHMARYWLDVARYGDTHGLHLDNERSMWPYRDWVVEAFNRNLPFDQFTIWQLAGDLLPDATREQKVASGYNRCNVSTSEGGAIDEEFQVRYAVDRVEATSSAWLGLTMGCAVCHDHKFDPILQKEFYQVFSIFNNISEKAMDGNALLPPPTLKLPTPEQEKQLKEVEKEISETEQKRKQLVSNFKYTDPASLTNAAKPDPKETVWIEDTFPSKAETVVNEGNEPNKWVTQAEGQVFSGEKSIYRSGKGLHQVAFPKCDSPLLCGTSGKLFAYIYLDPKNPPKSIMLQYHTDEWRLRANWGDADAIVYGKKGTPEKLQIGPLPEAGKWVRLEVDLTAFGLRSGAKITGMAFTQFDGAAWWDKAGLITTDDPAEDPNRSLLAWEKKERERGDKSSATKEIQALLKKHSDCTDSERDQLLRYFLSNVYEEPKSALSALRAELKAVKSKRDAIDKDVVSTMTAHELEKPRPAWVLIRGQYDKHGEEVQPGVPAVLPPLPPSESTNRLTFARWLVDPKHPLTARVTVNRLWQQFFGVGIVKTSEDFGTKGDWPSHPELLDWLATEFLRTGWDVKQCVRSIVTSATYRQDSRTTSTLAEMDPENRLLARGPRYRMDAEALRDNALFLSGLMNMKMGGRGVRPYQPPGIWEAVGYTASNTAKYTQDSGDALYRRSLYLFWKRTAPPPSMVTFDAPSREQCRTRRERTNTPLQALLMMNDPQYFEAARQLGYRMLNEGGNSDGDRLGYGFRLATARVPSEKEKTILADTLAAQRKHFEADAEASKKAVAVGESPVPSDVSSTDLAAYTMVANLLLNLDEVITKN
jgi:hypothetical protein